MCEYKEFSGKKLIEHWNIEFFFSLNIWREILENLEIMHNFKQLRGIGGEC